MKIAYFGEPGSYTQKAAKLYFGDGHEFVPCSFISDVFQAAKKGGCEFGVVPIENRKEGYVNETYDQLRETSLTIHGTVNVKINHCLAAVPGARIDGIKMVHSHIQALSQCRKFIRKLGAEPVQFGNTASSARMIAELGSKSDAAISSEEAARLHGLDILASRIAGPGNVTEFIVLARKPSTEAPDTTFLVLSMSDRTGSLADITHCFKVAGVNLVDLYKRPISTNGVVFNVECKAGIGEREMQRALKLLRQKAENVKVIGSYKKATVAR